MPPEVNKDKCTGAGDCLEVCPVDPKVFAIEGGKSNVVHPEECIECGACEAACPSGASNQNGFTNEQLLAEVEGALV